MAYHPHIHLLSAAIELCNEQLWKGQKMYNNLWLFAFKIFSSVGEE